MSVNIFITTAHIPYFTNVIIANASNNLKFFFKIKPTRTKQKKRLAVGLSGTKTRKMAGVSAN